MGEIIPQAKLHAALFKVQMTQKELAAKIGINAGTLNMIIKGRINCFPEERAAIAKALQMDQRELFI